MWDLNEREGAARWTTDWRKMGTQGGQVGGQGQGIQCSGLRVADAWLGMKSVHGECPLTQTVLHWSVLR